ncbi:probable E3 SUMO-protein ligase RNF212 isoform X2 [Anolis carolinensis]|uniref:probable E3 SUMO-protein ligase RNF212 isoform X2 n=1 Tax=Anolis carolinensis TaxID=28377 RepID=UPI000462D403|nr:PREDICTED: probable E3 SUMO-protein ligase RNF212 isoform X2 [Anolis carolinensis]|eukprot:XP_008123733.1 PREDICTED: probable E3 SUMO-protein ligase RNF212 isoform X2 [Anolis carolinensis]
MAALVFCNACFQKPQGATLKFSLTSCGHVFCEPCLQKGKKDECLICRAPCRTILLSKKMSPDIQALFMGIDGLCTKYSKELTQITQFQEKHRQRLSAYYKGKVDTVAGPTRISLISPPHDGHMGSVSCRSSQLPGNSSCHMNSSGSIRSSPLRIPTNRTSYMSQFASSQDNRSHMPNAFGPRTAQHYPSSSLSAMTKHSVSFGSLLQRQHSGSGSVPGHSLQK